MNDKTRRVFNGWLSLSPTEHNYFAEAVRQYREAADQEQRRLRESNERVLKLATGPLGQICPCCGR